MNWPPIHDRVNQCALSSIYKFHANKAPGYVNEVFSHAESKGIPTRCSYQKLKLPHCKTNQGLRALLYTDPSLWNKLGKFLKVSVSLNAFKHNLKDYYFRKGNKKEGKVRGIMKPWYLCIVSSLLLFFILFICILIYFCIYFYILIYLLLQNL